MRHADSFFGNGWGCMDMDTLLISSTLVLFPSLTFLTDPALTIRQHYHKGVDIPGNWSLVEP